MSDQAMKLFEALSGVDEELLERCNQKENGKSVTVYRLFGKYGRAMAACVCLIVVGAAAWSGYRLITGSGGENLSGSYNQAAEMPAELSDMAQSFDIADAGTAKGYEEARAENTTAVEGMESAGGADTIEAEAESDVALGAAGPAAEQQTSQSAVESAKTSDTASPGTVPDSYTGNDISEIDNMTKRMSELLKKESELVDSREAVPWEEACSLEPFAGYLPTYLPAGYQAFSARQSALPDEWNNVIFKWSDGEYILSLSMTQGEVMTREEIDKRDGLNEYLAEEIRKELISGAQLDGHIYFTLYYADGMRIDFDGYVTVDEMWELVESVSK